MLDSNQAKYMDKWHKRIVDGITRARDAELQLRDRGLFILRSVKWQ